MSFFFGATGSDVTAPLVVSRTVPIAGTTYIIVFNEAVTHGAGGTAGHALTASGGAVTPTYSSGAGTNTLTYTLSRTISAGETITETYTQPGNGVEDIAGNDCATYTNQSVTNSAGAGPDAWYDASTTPSAYRTLNSSTAGWSPVTIVTGGTATKIRVYGAGYGGETIKAALYDASDNLVDSCTISITTGDLQYWEGNLAGTAVSAANYSIAVAVDSTFSFKVLTSGTGELGSSYAAMPVATLPAGSALGETFNVGVYVD